MAHFVAIMNATSLVPGIILSKKFGFYEVTNPTLHKKNSKPSLVANDQDDNNDET